MHGAFLSGQREADRVIAARGGTTVNAMECRLDEEIVLENMLVKRQESAAQDAEGKAAAVTVSF